MRLFKSLFMLIVLASFTSIASAGTIKEELTLYKDPLYEFVSPRDRGGSCEGLFFLKGDKNNPDLRSNFQYFHCEGSYTLTLDGPKDKLVTLFGGFNYGKKDGFLILRKADNKKVWILDLMDFPSGRWISVPPQEGPDGEYGAYEIFYSPSPIFDQKVSSLKWGQWWQGDRP